MMITTQREWRESTRGPGRRSRRWSAALLGAALATGSAAPGATIHVPADQPTIQAAIAAASGGDTVLVHPGTYAENIDFLGKSITVASTDGPRVTTIDGGSGKTVVFVHGETAGAVLRGFTITNDASGIQTAGISIFDAGPTVVGNVIVGTGDGISIRYGTPVVRGNLISDTRFGPGVGAEDSGARVEGNAMMGNAAGGVGASGEASITGNAIIGNSGTGIGALGAVSIIQNLIAANDSFMSGAGIYFESYGGTVLGNTVALNTGGGAALWVYPGSATTIANNLLIGENGAAAVACSGYPAVAAGPLIFTSNDAYSFLGLPYMDCPDATGTNGNISADPLFVGALSADLHLSPGSPAIDAGAAEPSPATTDMDGDPRMIGSAVDIGTDEYSPSGRTIGFSPSGLHFEPQTIGTATPSQSIVCANRGSSRVHISFVGSGAEFPEADDCGAHLDPGETCTVQVRFSPKKPRGRVSALAVFTADFMSPQVVVLSGFATAPLPELDGGAFLPRKLGTASTAHVPLINYGNGGLLISSMATSGDYSETDDCPRAPAQLGPGETCYVDITFSPTEIGYRDGVLTVTDNATSSPQSFPLTGIGLSLGEVSLSPAALAFPLRQMGSTSDPVPVTLTNSGTAAVGLLEISSEDSDFPATSDCPVTLPPGASCTIAVRFRPNIYRPYGWQGSLLVSSDADTPIHYPVSGSAFWGRPVLTSLSPASVPLGTGPLTLRIFGAGFAPSTYVVWNGAFLVANVESASAITVNVPAGSVASLGTSEVAVWNGYVVGGGLSAPLPFTVYQPKPYVAQIVSDTYRTIAGVNLGLSAGGSTHVESPFPIRFGGGAFTSLWPGSDGTISFSGPPPSSYEPQPLPNGEGSLLVAPFWMTLDPHDTGPSHNVFWSVEGSAPNRELVVEWRDVTCYCISPRDDGRTVTFQVVFVEGRTDVLFNYKDVYFGDDSYRDAGAGAEVGIQVAPGRATQFSYKKPSLADGMSILWRISSGRGDANGDGSVGIEDVFYLINYLFAGGPSPANLCGGDTNADGLLDVRDVFDLINYLYAGAPPPNPSC